MTEPAQAKHWQVARRIALEFLLPAAVFAVGVGLGTNDFLASVVTGSAISGAICLLYWLDVTFLRPRLKRVPRDWLRLGLEMTAALLEHLVGALVVLLVCSRLFGFVVVPTATWIALTGMVLAFPVIHGTETALRYYRQLREKELVAEQLRALATEAELKALRAQIDPHFLFNTLNTIAQLIHSDSSQAEATVERLGELFRYVLASSERGMVPLEEELAFVDSYLEIERARFGERLRVSCEIAPETRGVLVPSLILQPLVENAVRHGRGPDGSVDLAICAHRQGDAVIVAITDQGPGMQQEEVLAGAGGGHGLRNVDTRLRKAYGEERGLEATANIPRGTRVSFRVPLQTSEPASP
jgi:signal transduction histidine kinase